jgi:hypothetical protein
MNSTAIEWEAASGSSRSHGDVCNSQKEVTCGSVSHYLYRAHGHTKNSVMPRSRAPPLGAPLFIQRLNVTLELRLGTHKTKPRLLVELFSTRTGNARATPLASLAFG